MNSRVVLGMLIGTGIVLPGVLDFALKQAGYPALGALVWAMGYGGMVLAIWYNWIRPLDLTGQGGGTEP